MRVICFLSKKDLNFFEKEKRLVEEVNVEGRAFHILGPWKKTVNCLILVRHLRGRRLVADLVL